MLWLAAAGIGLAWLLRPAPVAEPGAGLPLASAFLPAWAPVLVTEPVVLEGPWFDPTLDLNPVTVSPFVEHLYPVPEPLIIDEMPLSPVPEPLIIDEMPLYPVPVPLAEPWTEAETWAWIMTRPVIQLYPELAQRLHDDLERNIARGIPGQPWFSVASLEVWVKGHAGTWLSSGRQIAPGYITTEYGTPDNPGFVP